jgi:type IV pilus assembly protein PilC
MQRAGLPILETLKLLEGQTTVEGMKKVIETIRTDLEQGNSLSKCFQNTQKFSIPSLLTLLKQERQVVSLILFMSKIVTNLEKKEKIKSQIKSAFSIQVYC